jgi:hypothetical protein
MPVGRPAASARSIARPGRTGNGGEAGVLTAVIRGQRRKLAAETLLRCAIGLGRMPGLWAWTA